MKAGWDARPLGEMAQVVNGGTPKSKVKEYWGGDVQWLTPKDMGQMIGREIGETPRTISEEGLNGSSARLVPERSVILSTRAPIGHLAVNTVPMAFNQGCRGIVPGGQLDHVYLYYFLAANKELLNNLGTGTTFKELSATNLKGVTVPLPPLEEQQRIVAVLDEAFEGLARARAHAEANLQNARELFESWAANAFNLDSARDVASTDLTIRDVCTIQSGAGFPKKHQGNSKGDFPFYKVSDMNLEGNEWELFKAINYVSEGTRSELGARVFPIGSIVFPKVGGAILTNKKRVVSVAGCVDNNVMGLIPDQKAIVPEYLHEWLRATDIYEFSNKANPPSITQATISTWPIRLPDRNEQERVVGEAVDLRARTNTLIGAYTAALGNLNDLRQSLLQKAFAGELT